MKKIILIILGIIAIVLVIHLIRTHKTSLPIDFPTSNTDTSVSDNTPTQSNCDPLSAEKLSYCSILYTADQISKQTFTYSTPPSPQGAGTESLGLDLYLPPNPNKAIIPVAIFAHGMGSLKGDELPVSWCRDQFAVRGWACASIDYRLALTSSQEQSRKISPSDMMSAIRWIRLNATKYNLDPNKIITIGISRGASTSITMGISGNNISDPYYNDPIVNTANRGVPSNSCYSVAISGRIDTQSISTLADKNDPPILLYHGQKDPTIPYNDAVTTYNTLQDKGLETYLVPFPNGTHSIGATEVPTIVKDLFPRLYETVIKGSC